MLERQTLRVGSVAAILAFLLGLSFQFGGKSASVDSLGAEVHDMRNSVATLTTSINSQAVSNAQIIQGLQDSVAQLTKQVDELKSQAEYRAAGGKR